MEKICELTTSAGKSRGKSSEESHDITIEDIDEVIQRECSQTLWSGSERQADQSDDSSQSIIMNPNDPKNQMHKKPCIEIVVQPASKALRFRYECEGRSAGSLPGANSTQEVKTFPAIRIANCKGPAVVVVSCVTKDFPHRPHPHKLVGKDGCKRGICTMTVNPDNMVCTFSNLGIQCVKKKDVEDSLREREEMRVDPFRTGFDHRNQASNIDLNSVRLCFQAFIEGTSKGKFTEELDPIVSDPIYDKKAMSDLVICKLSACSGTVKGGTEIILLCEKITKDDTDVVLTEVQDDRVIWEGLGDFQPNDVHKQVAITFKTPPYHNQEIQQPVEVRLQLRRRSDMTMSEPRAFQYTPVDLDPECLQQKRRKVAKLGLQKYVDQNTSISALKSDIASSSFADPFPAATANRVDMGGPRLYKSPQRRFIKQEQDPIYQQLGYDFGKSIPTHQNIPLLQTIPIPQNINIPIPQNITVPPNFQFYHNPTPSSSSHSPIPDQMQGSPRSTPGMSTMLSSPMMPKSVSPLLMVASPMQAMSLSTSPIPPSTSPMRDTTTPLHGRIHEAMNMTNLEPSGHQMYLIQNPQSDYRMDDGINAAAPMQVANADDTQQQSLDLNFSLDSADFNNLLPLSDASMNALVSNISGSSFHLSSLESITTPDAYDSLGRLQNELNLLGHLSNQQ